MDRSYIVETLPSHAGHPESKILLVHIGPTPDMPTYRMEYHLGRPLSFAKIGPQPGHHKRYINQYQSIYDNLTLNWKRAFVLMFGPHTVPWGMMVLGWSAVVCQKWATTKPTHRRTERPSKPALIQRRALCLFILAHLPHGMMAHEWSTLVPEIWATALS